MGKKKTIDEIKEEQIEKVGRRIFSIFCCDRCEDRTKTKLKRYKNKDSTFTYRDEDGEMVMRQYLLLCLDCYEKEVEKFGPEEKEEE